MLAGSVMDMPFDEACFDLAVSLDVIEHLEDDLGALRELRRVVAPGGALLVTVPAYQWLWSGHDEINHHHRRYNRRTLLAAAERRRLAHAELYDLLQLAPAPGRDPAARARAPQAHQVEPRPVGAPRAAELAARAAAQKLEASVIGRGGPIPAGLSLLAVFR